MSWLDGPLTSVALCWRIERRDGVTIGLTAHDRPLEIDHLTYRAAPGMMPSAIARSAGLDADSMDVTGALTDAAIGEADLLAGRWDGAQITLFAVDWQMPAAQLVLGSGTIGAVETRGGMLSAELRGASARLERPVVEETSPECRAALGDKSCRVAMAGRVRFARVLAVEGSLVTIDAAEPVANAYGGGRLRWLDGANCGLEGDIAQSDGTELILRRPPRHEGAGALVQVREGCDRSLATCAGRFGNAANFRGEPYLPGMDLLMRYPGA